MKSMSKKLIAGLVAGLVVCSGALAQIGTYPVPEGYAYVQPFTMIDYGYHEVYTGTALDICRDSVVSSNNHSSGWIYEALGGFNLVKNTGWLSCEIQSTRVKDGFVRNEGVIGTGGVTCPPLSDGSDPGWIVPNYPYGCYKKIDGGGVILSSGQ